MFPVEEREFSLLWCLKGLWNFEIQILQFGYISKDCLVQNNKNNKVKRRASVSWAELRLGKRSVLCAVPEESCRQTNQDAVGLQISNHTGDGTRSFSHSCWELWARNSNSLTSITRLTHREPSENSFVVAGRTPTNVQIVRNAESVCNGSISRLTLE